MKSNHIDNYKVIVWHQFMAKVRESCDTKNSLTVYKGTFEQCEKFIDIFKDISYNNWEEFLKSNIKIDIPESATEDIYNRIAKENEV